jgi:hypothetical protein
MTEPPADVAAKPLRPWWWRYSGGLTILALILGFAIVGVISNSRAGGDSLSDNLLEAKSSCESRVKDQLKSPSTAKFDSEAHGTGPFTVDGFVDSANSFGAMVRSDFSCKVRVESDANYVAITSFTGR